MTKSWNYRPWKEEVLISGVPALVGAAAIGALSQVFNPVALAVAAAFGISAVYKVYSDEWLGDKSDIQALIKGGVMTPLDPKNPRDAVFMTQLRQSAVRAGLPENSLTPYFISDGFLMFTMLGESPEQPVLNGMPPDMLDAQLKWVVAQREIYFGVMTSQGYLATTPQALEKFSDEASRHYILMHERMHQKLNDSLSVTSVLSVMGLRVIKPLLLATASLAVFNFVMDAAGTDPNLLSHYGPFNGGGYIWGPVRAALTLAVSAPLYMAAMAGAARRIEYRADRNTLYKTGDLQSAVDTIRKLGGLWAPSGVSERVSAWFALHPPGQARADFMKAIWPKIIAQYDREGRPNLAKQTLAPS